MMTRVPTVAMTTRNQFCDIACMQGTTYQQHLPAIPLGACCTAQELLLIWCELQAVHLANSTAWAQAASEKRKGRYLSLSSSQANVLLPQLLLVLLQANSCTTVRDGSWRQPGWTTCDAPSTCLAAWGPSRPGRRVRRPLASWQLRRRFCHRPLCTRAQHALLRVRSWAFWSGEHWHGLAGSARCL
jgi:hypothetical protein